RAEGGADARLRAPRFDRALPGGPPDQPRTRGSSDRPAQPVARVAPARRRGRRDRERPQPAHLRRLALAPRRAARDLPDQARGGLTRCLAVPEDGEDIGEAPSQIIVPPEHVAGAWANWARVDYSEHEFTIDF